jgi:hypothetical protein
MFPILKQLFSDRFNDLETAAAIDDEIETAAVKEFEGKEK